MDPQVKSMVTSFGMLLAGMFSGWAASSGIIPSDQAPAVQSALMTLGGVIVAGGIGYLKTRAHTPQAIVDAVNSNAVPGVMAVKESSAIAADLSPVVVTNTGAVKESPPAPMASSAKPELK